MRITKCQLRANTSIVFAQHEQRHWSKHVAMPYMPIPASRATSTARNTNMTVASMTLTSDHGIPDKVIRDSGSHYTTVNCSEHLQRCGNSNTFLPTLPSHKRIHRGKVSIYPSEATPVDSDVPSPAELLFNRKILSTHHTLITNINPRNK